MYQGLVPTSVIILVHFDIAVGNHTSTDYQIAALSTMQFGSNLRKGQRQQAFDVTTRDSGSTPSSFDQSEVLETGKSISSAREGERYA